ncbi:MAG: hypothetical protein ACI9QD_000066 [Thermoproteota archaeon]|jgi:hypothetical protein
MKKIIVIGFFIGFVLAVIGHQQKFSITPVWQIPNILTAMRAKEFCSCYFLLKNKKAYCLAKVKKGYPAFGHNVDDKNKSVSFTILYATTTSEVKNPRLGCKLL